MKLEIVSFLVFLVVSVNCAIMKGSLLQLTQDEILHLYGDQMISHKVVFHMKQSLPNEEKDIGQLHLALFGNVVPKTVKNFVELSKMTYGYGYVGSKFHRIIANFMIQGGDFKDENGASGHSIYNDRGKFDDENFDLSHNKKGRLSMANSGPNSNGAQFFITHREDCGYLDGKHVVFGQLIGGHKVLDYIATYPVNEKDAPEHPIYIDSIDVFDIDPVQDNYSELVKQQEEKQLLDNTSNYKWLFILLQLFIVAFFLNRWYQNRQFAKDLQENSYYHE